MKKEYICECGKEFDNPQKFNGHKSHCEIHLKSKGVYEKNLSVMAEARQRSAQSLRLRYEKYYTDKLERWISERHVCEKCGKTMAEKYGSGRFCSEACARSFATISKRQEINEKVSKTLNESIASGLYKPPKNKGKKYHVKSVYEKYLHNTPKCAYCGNVIPYERRYRKTCSKECAKKILGGYRKGCGHSKHGYYKGIWLDSSYELVYVIYNLDNGIEFKRCSRTYSYEYKGKMYNYHPDFELPDGSLVEIKGYRTELTDLKISAVTDSPITVLYKEDLEYAFNWVKKHYEYRKLEDLYDT